MFTKKRKRMDNAISAGSMADIAFLLLIFFLVTTTIVEDKGIMVKLPPWDTDDSTVKPPGKNILSLKINGSGDVMFEGQQMEVGQLKEATQDFIMNKTKRKDRPSSPNKAIISLQNDRATLYEKYIEVYDILKSAYAGLWNDVARQQHGVAFNMLSVQEKRAIKKKIPMVISEAEPSNFGENAPFGVK